ncbi:MAG: GTP-binding protein HSR1-related protein [Candidatus Sulfotelmatobacter sp.]|nr:GTP-binding protein HSR1-related protein [Candidatus Sulfotelmatobacter sp.]
MRSSHPKKTRSRAPAAARLPLGTEVRKEENQERAFLVGIDVRTRGRGKGAVTAQAQAARDAASASVSSAKSGPAGKSVSNKPSIPEFDADESLAELRTLAASAGAKVVGEILQRRDRPDPATLIGAGKLEEISGAAASANADLLLFDHDLTASQQRNIEKIVKLRVIDRTQLILDIFARHARTREGQLQVELAQLQYMLPRLAGRGVEMSQLGGGIGTRGPGETQLETDRRKIYRRVRHVEQQLENVRRIRAQQRQRRESAPVATVALVGYTNAGKSTLFNALTKAAVLSSPRMFATLDPTIRSIVLPSKRKVLMSDTVGFIRSLPHTLVSAFRATLEEVQRASLILQVSDASSRLSAEQDAQVEIVLKELEAEKKPRLRVMNKVDLLDVEVAEALVNDAALDAKTVYVSAAEGTGLDKLLARIDAMIEEDRISRVRLRIPQKEGKSLAILEAQARIYSRKYKDGAVELEADAPESVVRRVREWVVTETGSRKGHKSE